MSASYLAGTDEPDRLPVVSSNVRTMRPFAIALIVLAQMPTLTVQDPDRERREERRVQKLLPELESGSAAAPGTSI